MSCKPSFLLKPSAYKTNKLYAILPDNGDGDMAISSYVGNGTRVRSDGIIETVATDTPRIDYHDGIGLLLEPTRTNLVFYSDQVTSTTWNNGATNTIYTPADTISPTGEKDATKIEDALTSEAGYIYRTTAVSDATAIHTFSFFYKFGNRDTARVQYSGDDSNSIEINSDGTITIEAGTDVTAVRSSKYINEWWRFELVIDMPNTDTDIAIYLYPGGGYPLDNDTTGYGWFHAPQIEEGYFATSWIPTPAAVAVTRSYDYIAVGSIITNGLIGLTNGSFYVDLEIEDYAQDAYGDLISIGTGGGKVSIKTSTGTQNAVAYLQNTDTSEYTQFILTKRIKVLFNIFGDKTEVWVNGTKGLSVELDLSFTDEFLRLTGLRGRGKVKEIAMYNRTLTDGESKAKTQ